MNFNDLLTSFVLVIPFLIWPVILIVSCRVKKSDYNTYEKYLEAKYSKRPKLKSALIQFAVAAVLWFVLITNDFWLMKDGIETLMELIMTVAIIYLGIMTISRK